MSTLPQDITDNIVEEKIKEAKPLLCLLTFTAEGQVLLVVAECVKEHFLLFTALTRYQDILLAFIQLTAHHTTEHRNTTLQAKYIISIMTIMVSVISGAIKNF